MPLPATRASAARRRAPAIEAARKVGETVGRHPRLRALLDARLDPAVATGLALTVALVCAFGGGLLLGVLAYLVRTNSFLTGIDNGVAKWGHRHASRTSMRELNDVTQLGSIYIVVALCVILAVAETIRERSVWVAAFIVAVDGRRGGLDPRWSSSLPTAFVRPSTLQLRLSARRFPSGHSATAAAFYATAALLLGRWRPRRTRATLAGLAAGIAVAVAASRVLLDVHWLSDVIAGLALGWAWFAICGIAFGGRILRFGAGAETAARVADATLPDDQSGVVRAAPDRVNGQGDHVRSRDRAGESVSGSRR